MPLHSYGFMIAVGFLSVLYFIQRDAEREGFDPKLFADLAFVVLPLGLLGTRLAHIFMFPKYYSLSDPIGWIAVWNGGLVFQGGPPLAIAYGYWFFRKKGIPFWNGIDIIFPYVALGHGIGRIGCFLKGCCYGALTDVPWATSFPRILDPDSNNITGSPAFLSHFRDFSDITVESTHAHAIHPTQLYSFVGLMCILGIMLSLRKWWNPYTGFTFPMYFIIYGSFRFGLEFLRGDHNPVHAFGLSDQQLFSLGGVVIGIVFFFVLGRYQKNQDSKAA
ncbi:MAG: prolipoprotein diacylglyceryl transferase [Candidatus Hydrogenedentota bacterium]